MLVIWGEGIGHRFQSNWHLPHGNESTVTESPTLQATKPTLTTELPSETHHLDCYHWLETLL